MSTDSTADTITIEFPGFFRVYQDGRFECLTVFDEIPPAVDPITGVESKDVLISAETGVKARIFIPKINNPDQKLPLLLHFHGGGFCVGSAFDSLTGAYLTALASKARVLIVTVDYRLAPKHPLPAAFDDSWAALQWISTHSKQQGPDPWINQYADFSRVFVAGDSAGGTITHHVAVRAGIDGSGSLQGMRLLGAIIVHPYFAGSEPDPMMQYLYPGSCGMDKDPYFSPKEDPDLEKMGCSKVLVVVGEEDWWLKGRGVSYYETLKKSGWGGKLEWMENEGEGHCFYAFAPNSERVVPFMNKLATFMHQD